MPPKFSLTVRCRDGTITRIECYGFTTTVDKLVVQLSPPSQSQKPGVLAKITSVSLAFIRDFNCVML